MLQVFSNNSSTIKTESQNPQKNIDMIKEHINICNCEFMTVDITNMNIIDACMVSTLCSAEHYMKYPNGKIKWIVNSKKIKEYTFDMSLGNSVFIDK